MREKTDKTSSTIKTYTSFDQDFVASHNQDVQLPNNFQWSSHGWLYRLASAILYAIAMPIVYAYARFALHIKIENKAALKPFRKKGYFLYGNHTQPMGDAFLPARYIFPKRIVTIMGKANMGIPVIGRLLPMLGGVVLPEKTSDMRDFETLIQYYLDKKRSVVVYPEAHVWPWCTSIRPMQKAAFDYPRRYGVPAFCMTVTYHKRRHSNKPRAVTYIDGPFYADETASRKVAREKMADKIIGQMKIRAAESTYAFVQYVKIDT